MRTYECSTEYRIQKIVLELQKIATHTYQFFKRL
jgi:hypothetical protein